MTTPEKPHRIVGRQLKAKAIYHEDRSDPGDAQTVELTLEVDGDTLTFTLEIDSEAITSFFKRK
jgi:hypothetical protein